MSTEKRVKLDNGKNRLGLVLGGFSHALWLVGCVGTFGADKYTESAKEKIAANASKITAVFFIEASIFIYDNL